MLFLLACATSPEPNIDSVSAVSDAPSFQGTQVDGPGPVFKFDTPPYTAIAAGKNNVCALRPNGHIECHGSGDGDRDKAPLGSFESFCVGRTTGCAVDTAGLVTCWGEEPTHPLVMPPAGVFTDVACGMHANCGIRSNGSVECWGAADQPVLNPPPGAFDQISVGFVHACGVRPDQTVQCWGGNGPGPAPYLNVPQMLAVEVEAGNGRSCLLDTVGDIHCWGMEWEQPHTPIPLLDQGPYAELSMSYLRACALTQTGALTCDPALTPPPEHTQFPGWDLAATGYVACTRSPAGLVDCQGATYNWDF